MLSKQLGGRCLPWLGSRRGCRWSWWSRLCRGLPSIVSNVPDRRQGGAVLHAARSAAALYGCAVCGGSRGIAGERLAPRQPPLHPHAHALPSPSSPCACWRLHRGNQPRAIGAQPAVGRCEPAQRAQRPSLSRRKAWQRWELSLSCALCARVRRCGHAGALRRLCSAPACPACCPIA